MNETISLNFIYDNLLGETLWEQANYIHHNPVKRGYVNEAIHWRYSSARDYEGIDGLIYVEKFW